MQCGFSWVWAEELPEALVGPSTPFSLSTPLCGWRGGRLCVCVVGLGVGHLRSLPTQHSFSLY